MKELVLYKVQEQAKAINANQSVVTFGKGALLVRGTEKPTVRFAPFTVCELYLKERRFLKNCDKLQFKIIKNFYIVINRCNKQVLSKYCLNE